MPKKKPLYEANYTTTNTNTMTMTMTMTMTDTSTTASITNKKGIQSIKMSGKYRGRKRIKSKKAMKHVLLLNLSGTCDPTWTL